MCVCVSGLPAVKRRRGLEGARESWRTSERFVEEPLEQPGIGFALAPQIAKDSVISIGLYTKRAPDPRRTAHLASLLGRQAFKAVKAKEMCLWPPMAILCGLMDQCSSRALTRSGAV